MTEQTISSASGHDAKLEANQRGLAAALDEVRGYLEPASERAASVPIEFPALDNLCATFDLSPFERGLLLLCTGMELDPAFARTVAAYAQARQLPLLVTFGLALDVLPGASWGALSPASPLRYWRLVEVKNGDSLASAPLRIDERILHYLAGVDYLDERLSGLVEAPVAREAPVPSQTELADRIALVWSQHSAQPENENTPLSAIGLTGADSAGKRTVAATVCAILSLDLRRISAHAVPTAPSEREALSLLWTREAALGRRALYLDCDSWDAHEPDREAAVTRLIEGVSGPLFIASRSRRGAGDRPLLVYEVAPPTRDEQRELWRSALGPLAASLNGAVEPLVAQFRLNAPDIRAAAQAAVSRLSPQETRSSTVQTNGQTNGEVRRTLWDACRVQARPRLGNLAQFIQPAAGWDDLVLPAAQKDVLREIALQVRRRYTVYERWGFAERSSRGLGISALFVGSSGTGKTLAAEVLANTLRLDLYRIDLSAVVSKYIGETEKNLGRVFDAAEGSGAILLFDEADALFGKRSEVKDSHDRYANIEISYLLQRMEAYQGLAILTSNLKDALDTAFLRRIRFTVRFPFPDAEQRTEIWRRIFPSGTPTHNLDFRKLAQLNVAGGNIRNIALNAAFLAAGDGEDAPEDAPGPVRMRHLLHAARSEYAKLEKPLAEAEIRGWV